MAWVEDAAAAPSSPPRGACLIFIFSGDVVFPPFFDLIFSE